MKDESMDFCVKALALSGRELACVSLLPTSPASVILDSVEAALLPECFHIELNFRGCSITATETAEAIGLFDGAEVSVLCSLWRPLEIESADWQHEVGNEVVWCLDNGLVHIQGRLMCPGYHVNDYVQVASLPRPVWPCQTRIFEQSKAGVWGNARLRIQADGVLSIKPACSVWLAATWRAAAQTDCVEVGLEAAAGPSSALTMIQYAEGTVQIEGQMRHAVGNRNSQYVTVASLPPGLLAPGYRPALFEQSLAGVWGDARLEILQDGQVQLKPDYNTHIACMLYSGEDYQNLEYEHEFLQRIDASSTSVGVSVADGLVHLQGKLVINASVHGGGFVHVATLPSELLPRRDLMFQQAKAGRWGDARLQVRNDGTVWLKPAHSIWVAASWKPA